MLDRSQLFNEPRWTQELILTLGSSVKFVAEVVTGNVLEGERDSTWRKR